MHILMPQEEFSALLSRAQSVLERKSTRPILENVLLEAYEEKLRISSTDLRVSLVQESPCAVEQPGSISIPGRKLHEIVREMPHTEVSLEIRDNQWVTVTAGKSTFHLPGAPADEYPSLPPTPGSFLSVEAAVFRQMLEKTLFAASSDESRIYLCGVYVKAWRKEEDGSTFLRMVATDGHRLSLVDRPLTQELDPFQGGIIIPKKGLSELKSLLEGVEDTFLLAAGDDRLYARVDGVDLSVTLIDASFPNYEQVIPSEAAHLIHFDRAEFTNALRRVSLLSDQETHSVVLETRPPTAVLSSTSPQFGDAREEVPIEYEGEPLKLAFNANYVVEALRILEGDEVVLSLSDPLAPCLLKSPSDPGYLCVVMPMRID